MQTLLEKSRSLINNTQQINELVELRYFLYVGAFFGFIWFINSTVKTTMNYFKNIKSLYLQIKNSNKRQKALNILLIPFNAFIGLLGTGIVIITVYAITISFFILFS